MSIKQQVIAFVECYQGNQRFHRYSGKTKTLYIPEELHQHVIDAFGYGLPFSLGILNLKINRFKNRVF
jgi:hypothetical protein